MRFYRSIDWLSFTCDDYPKIGEKYTETRSPIPFYSHAHRYENGVLVSFGNPNSVRKLVTMSGNACSNLSLHNETKAAQWLGQGVRSGWKITRLDLAITVEHAGEVRVDDVRQWVRDGALIGPQVLIGHAKTVVNDAERRGETLYLGDMKKRAKNGIVRVYDKGIEMGEKPDWLTRFEVEMKRDVANTAAKKIAHGVSIGAVIKSRLDFGLPVWDVLTGGEAAPDMRFSDETTDDGIDQTWRWLVEKIAPVLARKIAEEDVTGTGPNTKLFYREVARKVQAHMLTMLDKV